MGMACMVAVHGGQGCVMATRMLVDRKIYDQAIEIATPGFENFPYGDPNDMGNLMGPLVSAKQRDRVLGYIEKGKAGGRARRRRRRSARAVRQGLVRAADALRRRHQRHDHRPRGDLRPGADRHPVRRRRRGRPPRQRQPVRPRRVRHLGLGGAGDGDGPAAAGRHWSASTAASPTAPTRRSVATRPAASGARTASRASSSTPRSRPTPSASRPSSAVRVAFVGAGQIGAPMSERLLAAGHDVTVYARRAEVREHFAAAGAAVTDSLGRRGARRRGRARVRVLRRAVRGGRARRRRARREPRRRRAARVAHHRQPRDHPAHRGGGATGTSSTRRSAAGADNVLAGTLTVMLGGAPDDVERACTTVGAYADPIRLDRRARQRARREAR